MSAHFFDPAGRIDVAFEDEEDVEYDVAPAPVRGRKPTNRDMAEATKWAKDYFTFASYRWSPVYLSTSPMSEFLCPDCKYVPRRDSTEPRRAYKAHIKKYHRSLWFSKYAKPYVIAEEEDEVNLVEEWLANAF